MAYNRRRTRSQNDRSGILRQQKVWTGLNKDLDPTELADGEAVTLENAIAFEKHVEERPGTFIYSNAVALVGDSYGEFFHKASQRWIFHIGASLFWAPLEADTLTEILDYADASFGTNIDTNAHTIMKEFQDGVLITAQGSSNSGLFFIRISESEPRFFNLTAPCPVFNWLPQPPYTPPVSSKVFRYRYLFTYSRIEDGGNNSTDRLNGGRVIHESGTRTALDDESVDYIELTGDDSFSNTALPSIDMTNTELQRPDQYIRDSSYHWTHISIYRTLDIGSDYGVDAKTGEKNDPELFIWTGDFQIQPLPLILFYSPSDDEVLRNRISSTDGASAFILKSRGYFPLGAEPVYSETPNVPSISNFGVSPNFILSVRLDKRTQIDYCQLEPAYHAGYHYPLQNKKLTHEINGIQIYQNLAVFCHDACMSGTDLNAYLDKGLSGSPMFTLESFYPLDPVNGVTDYATIAEVENGKFIALCSDKTVRIFGGIKFGEDLTNDKISKEIIKKAITFGAVGKFFNGAYLLWFSTQIDTWGNDRCVRLAVHKHAGRGWCEYTGYIQANKFHVGEVLVDDDGLHRLIAHDFVDGFLYEIETYDGPEESGITRSVVDKGDRENSATGTAIVSRIRLPDYTGELESFLCVHQVTNAYTRSRHKYGDADYAQDAETGCAEGFSLDVNGYEDGEVADSISDAPLTGDLEFLNPPKANRIGIEFIFNAGGWRLIRSDTHFRVIDQKQPKGINDTGDAGYLSELESGREMWISRGQMLDLERCLGARYLTSGSFSAITGPDEKEESAIEFSVTAGSKLTSRASWLAAISIADELTLSFWYKRGSAGFSAGDVFKSLDSVGDTDILVTIPNATTLQIPSLGVAAVLSTLDDGEWHHLSVRRLSGTITVHQNGVQVSSDTAASTVHVGRGTVYIGAPSCCIFDLCLYSEFKSIEALDYYRTDMLGNAGEKVLPYF